MTAIKTIRPAALKKGDTVAFIAPASPADSENETRKGAAYIESLGYKVKIFDSCFCSRGYLAGTDELRADDVNRAFADKSVSAVLCVRGGYGTPRILDRIDYRTVRENPKVFCGFSDITAMHCAIYAKTGLVTFHTPMPASCMADGVDDDVRENFTGLITREGPVGKYKSPEGSHPMGINGGKASGVLMGGNLTLVTSLCGTEYEIDYTDKILFFEEIEEDVYRIDRMLNTLRLCGAFEKCAGVVFGAFTRCEKKGEFMTIDRVIRELVAPSGKPILTGLSTGHIGKNISLPLGVKTSIDADAGTIEFVEKHLS